jgi:MFS family permease
LVPVEGWFVDRYGPRIVVAVGGILVAIAWMLNSYADSIALLYTAAIISGIGAGAVYGTCVGNALKWFVDRRGLAAGLTAAGFGAGAAATVVPIRQVIEAYGYEQAFFWFGLGQGVVILMVSQVLKARPRAPLLQTPSAQYIGGLSSPRPPTPPTVQSLAGWRQPREGSWQLLNWRQSLRILGSPTRRSIFSGLQGRR